MTNENEVDIELAKEQLDTVKEKVVTAGSAVQGFNPEAVFIANELRAIRQVIVAAGWITKARYTNLVADNLRDTLSEMIDLGIGDPSLLDDELDDVAES